MANSVSRINVTVGANVAGVVSGMNQAAGAVQGFSRSAGNMQMALQQAVFAVDDAATSFGTGGIAGAVRGAANNITMLGASLFGVKGLMIAVAATAATQLAMAFSKTRDGAKQASTEIEHAKQALTEFQEQLRRHSERPLAQISLRQQMRDVGEESTVSGAERRQVLGRETLSDLEEKLQSERDRISDLRQTIASVQGDEAVKAAKDELQERIKASRQLRDQIRDQKALNLAIDDMLQLLRENVAPGAPSGDRFGFFTRGAAAESIKAKLKAGQQSNAFDAMRMFSALPSANAFGSSGAVGTINQAMIGPKNVENAQLQELKTIARSTSDAARTLGSRLPSMTEVSL